MISPFYRQSLFLQYLNVTMKNSLPDPLLNIEELIERIDSVCLLLYNSQSIVSYCKKCVEKLKKSDREVANLR